MDVSLQDRLTVVPYLKPKPSIFYIQTDEVLVEKTLCVLKFPKLSDMYKLVPLGFL